MIVLDYALPLNSMFQIIVGRWAGSKLTAKSVFVKKKRLVILLDKG